MEQPLDREITKKMIAAAFKTGFKIGKGQDADLSDISTALALRAAEFMVIEIARRSIPDAAASLS